MLLKVLQLDLTTKSGKSFHPLETFLVYTYITKVQRTVPNNKTESNKFSTIYLFFKCMQIMLER